MTEQDKITQLEALVRRARSVSAEIKAGSEELKALMARIDELTEVGWKMDIDGVPASKRRGNRSFSASAAYDSLTPEERLTVLRTGRSLVDDKLVRALVESKGTVEQFMVEADLGKARVELL